MQDLLRIISAFPLLETLALHDAKFIQSHPLSDVVIKRFASKSPIRLQRLSIDEDTFAVIIDWIERSGVCTCLRDLAIVPSKGGLRMVDTDGCDIRFEPQRTPYLVCRWQSCGILIHNASIDVAGRLGGFLSAARSRQLQRVTISSRADAGPNFNNDKICRVLKELDLRDLHKIMDGPCFEGLVVVQAKWSIGTYEVDPDARDGVIQGFTTLVRELFAPWIRRGLVDLSCEAV
ncbi:hypothetical protein EVJ58_g8776 [Rhodofomes roseus]|uniref:Uncharacterized protein n=1 Tax=Rhodofomes roseus TaxID=34475 RepID=A0A4Y9XZM2_9APHY|nr:hypothetical protein EVJ58_g8776 [Rhodofomes roseus]